MIEIHKIFKYYEDAKIQNIFSVVKLDKMRIVEENANHHGGGDSSVVRAPDS